MKRILIAVLLVSTVGGGVVAAHYLRLFNRPPGAEFSYRTPTRTLDYVLPTDEDTIMFVNKSTDPDGDTLTYSWFVDGIQVNNTKDHSMRLTAGTHKMPSSCGHFLTRQQKAVGTNPQRVSAYSTTKGVIPSKEKPVSISTRVILRQVFHQHQARP